MVNRVRPGYVNPLTMMKNNKQTKHMNLGIMKTEEKKQKELESKKQSMQNSLLLMKGASGNGETSEESIRILEKKLEEITNEIKTGVPERVEGAPDEEKQAVSYQKAEREEEAGLYRVMKDDAGGYKIEYEGKD